MAFAFSLMLLKWLGTSREEKDFIVLPWGQRSNLSHGWFMDGMNILCIVLMYSPRLEDFISFLLTGVLAAIPSLIPTYLIIFTLFFPLISNLSSYLPHTKGKKKIKEETLSSRWCYISAVWARLKVDRHSLLKGGIKAEIYLLLGSDRKSWPEDRHCSWRN